jgi:oxepin-CoA hydrolase/3-oxo-5,6-dehydrosuberyl-CoA semialdehyde dehydrogenase
MERLESYVGGRWIAGSGDGQKLVNPASEEPLAAASSEGLDLAGALGHAREAGAAALGALSFAERGALLAAMAKRIHEHRDALLDVAVSNGGNTRSDAKFDVDGASATLQHYAELGGALGDARLLSDGEATPIGRSPRLCGRHFWAPRPGVALLVNAFNFPAWGFAEKAACALLAGVPVVCKPATSTALLAQRLVAVVAEVAPPGTVSLVCGPAHGLPALLDRGDVLAFTGSSVTAAALRTLPGVLRGDVRLSVEADSLNAAILGPDAEPGGETYELFVRDVVREMTQKTGQKCTAVRRIFVPSSRMERARADLAERLKEIRVGDPKLEEVRMGPLATADQLRDVRAGIDAVRAHARLLVGAEAPSPAGVPAGRGFFVPPTLLEASDPGAAVVHELEIFGPVATLLAAPEEPRALGALVARGGGMLVGSIYSDDREYVARAVAALAPHHGRIVVGSARVADKAPSPGTALPALLHGGPGRAGGGEELGGLRGLALYSQRCALQGDRALVDAALG